MGICSECFSMLNVYWKYTRKWFLAMIAGMAALELGLLLYYVNGGYRNMYITEGNNKVWPMEYGGALQSIRLEYIVLIFAVIFVVVFVLSYLFVNSKNTAILLQRLPISTRMHTLIQIINSLIVLISLWLVQFLIIIAGFLIYRYSAPDGLLIDVQIFKIFWYPGLLAKLYPFLNIGYCVLWLLSLVCLSVLPSFIVHRVRMRGFLWLTIFFIIILIAWFFTSILNAEVEAVFEMVFIFLLDFAMIWILFFRRYYAFSELDIKPIS